MQTHNYAWAQNQFTFIRRNGGIIKKRKTRQIYVCKCWVLSRWSKMLDNGLWFVQPAVFLWVASVSFCQQRLQGLGRAVRVRTHGAGYDDTNHHHNQHSSNNGYADDLRESEGTSYEGKERTVMSNSWILWICTCLHVLCFSPGHWTSYEYPRFSGAGTNISALVTGGQKGTMLNLRLCPMGAFSSG